MLVGAVSDYLSLTDLFLVGLALDLTGALLLARGLLASPALIGLRGRYGAILDVVNTPQVVAEVRDRVVSSFGVSRA